MTPEEKQEFYKELAGFMGTENHYKHTFGITYTDGVQYLANKGNCYWLLDSIASHQTTKIKKVPFQVWELAVRDNKTSVLTMSEDVGMPLLVEQRIPYTDFPLPEIKLWLIDGILILPSEY